MKELLPVVVVVGLALAGFVGLRSAAANSQGWSDKNKTEYSYSCMDSCNNTADICAKYCSCTLGKMQESYTEKEAAAIGGFITQGHFPDKVIKLAAVCRTEAGIQ